MCRALAIQWGLAKNENPNQGSSIIEERTDLVEKAAWVGFERLPELYEQLGKFDNLDPAGWLG
ncbi:MAG: hypothetical protein WB783_18725 [Arenicellales bacterium]